MTPSVESGSPAVTTEIVSPDTLVRINSPILVRTTFSEPVSGFTVGDVIVGNGTAGGFTGSDGDAVYTFNVTPNAIGVVTADIPADAAADGDGSGNTAAAQLWLGIPYDDDRDDGISKYEAISAVRDYFDGQLTKENTIGVIRLYFQAIAGADSEALELTTVMLDGSAPVPAAVFQWEQLNNGSPTVVLASADTTRASFTLPALSNNQDFIFRLTVTYAGGHTSQDTVTVTGRPTPGIIVGAVSGHTASLNGAAEFGVQLRSRPSAEVVIPLSSSDESEGIPEQTQVVFTPENWNREQVVVVRGQNADVQGGVQGYEIIVGNSQSSDRFYDGLETANVAMRGIALGITAPGRIEPLIANILARIDPRVTYTGRNRLSFALTEAPAGMSIDFSYGTITWTPQESDEGRTFDVTIKVNDGAIFSEASFQVTVILPEPLATEIQENMLTVADTNTTLDGLEITSPPDTPPMTLSTLEELQTTLGKAPPDSVPEIPSWITPISDVFVVTRSFDNPVKVRFPITQLPGGVSLNEVNLYAYVEAMDVDGPFWSTVLLDSSIEGTEDNLVIAVELTGLRGMAFFGYHHTSPAIPFEPDPSDDTRRIAPSGPDSSNNKPRATQSEASNTSRSSTSVTPPDIGLIHCNAEEGWLEHLLGTGPNYDVFICTYEEDEDVEIQVKNFGNGCRWAPVDDCSDTTGRKVEDLAVWVVTAQLAFEELGLGYDKDITVKIEQTRHKGYVTTRWLEGRRTIHLSDFNARPPDEVRYIIFHEYFHHVQGHDENKAETEFAESSTLFIDKSYDRTGWLLEGTAEWFPEELEDSLNEYKKLGLHRIMEAGVNSRKGDGYGTKNPYLRFSFFKLLGLRCDDFNSRFRTLLSDRPYPTPAVPIDPDPSGIRRLSSWLDEASCNFGDHLGHELSASLEAAIVYHNYATQFHGDINLLDDDDDEPQVAYIGPSSYQPNGLHLVRDIPPAGAYSFKLLSTGAQLAQGEVTELVFEAHQEVIVSVTSSDPEFEGMNTIGSDEDAHIWFYTGNQPSQSVLTYGDGPTVPEIFVTLVNPSLTSGANVEVSFRIRDEGNVDLTVGPIITSHTDGAQVSDRVVTVRGSMPEEGRDATKEVIVTANGIETRTALNLDGSFAADVVIGFGDNSIKAQGFDDQATPVTNETGITIEGISSSSTRPNALIPSRVVFVLRWDTDRTDIDLHSTDGEGGHIYFGRRTVGPGNLDRDDVFGFGPEVISYRETDDNVYVNGTFDVDVHYFSGRRAGQPATNYTLDVILNESGVGDRRLRRFESITPLTRSDLRFNSILGIFCGSERVCGLDHYDNTKLSPTGISTPSQPAVRAAQSARAAEVQHGGPKPFPSAYEQCMSELETGLAKSGSVDWSCNPDGTKQWP